MALCRPYTPITMATCGILPNNSNMFIFEERHRAEAFLQRRLLASAGHQLFQVTVYLHYGNPSTYLIRLAIAIRQSTKKISHWIVSNFPSLCLTLQIKSKWTKERRRKDASSQKEQQAKPERKPKWKTRTGTTTPMGTNYSYPKRRKLTDWYVPLSLHAYSIFIH